MWREWLINREKSCSVEQSQMSSLVICGSLFVIRMSQICPHPAESLRCHQFLHSSLPCAEDETKRKKKNSSCPRRAAVLRSTWRSQLRRISGDGPRLQAGLAREVRKSGKLPGGGEAGGAQPGRRTGRSILRWPWVLGQDLGVLGGGQCYTEEERLAKPWDRMLLTAELSHMVQSHELQHSAVEGPGGAGFREDKETLALIYSHPVSPGGQVQSEGTGWYSSACPGPAPFEGLLRHREASLRE